MRLLLLPVSLAGLLPALPGQALPGCPPGYRAEADLTERSQPSLVRGFAYSAATDDYFLALSRTVFHRPDPWTWNTVHQFGTGEEVATLCHPSGQGLVYFTALNAGTVHVLDPVTGTLGSFGGVANIFDLAIGPGGEVIASANPTWPAPNAGTGLWCLGPGVQPREMLRLTGPSGPVVFDPAGNLLVAELGPVVPPPPGAVRILRFPRARWQQAWNAGTLTPAAADLISTGWNGAYDLAFDDLGRLYVTDANSGAVARTAPGTLMRDPVAACSVATGGLHLQYVPDSAPFLAFQPAERAGALLIGNGDFVSEYVVHRLQPARPALGVWPGLTFGAGTARFDVAGGPAGGLAFLAASTASLLPETVAAVLDGAPIWVALDPTAPLATAAFVLDGRGTGSIPLRHPGGFGLQVHFQSLVLAPSAAPYHCTSAAVTVQLLP